MTKDELIEKLVSLQENAYYKAASNSSPGWPQLEDDFRQKIVALIDPLWVDDDDEPPPKPEPTSPQCKNAPNGGCPWEGYPYPYVVGGICQNCGGRV